MSKFFSKFATVIADLSGKPATFVGAVALVLVWAGSGPFFGYSETWQFVINTSTTIITFLMVFVLQNSQNRDGKALQAKLDELILTSQAMVLKLLRKFRRAKQFRSLEMRQEELLEKAPSVLPFTWSRTLRWIRTRIEAYNPVSLEIRFPWTKWLPLMQKISGSRGCWLNSFTPRTRSLKRCLSGSASHKETLRKIAIASNRRDAGSNVRVP